MLNNVPILNQNRDGRFFNGKMETFLTCRALAAHLKEKNVLLKEWATVFEEVSLNAVQQSLYAADITNLHLLFSELPNILPLNYPAVENIRKMCVEIIPQIKSNIQRSINNQYLMGYWKYFNEFDNLLRMLKTFDKYKHS